MIMDLDTFIESGLANISLVEEQYAKYQQDPSSVDASWQQLFLKSDKGSFPIPEPKKQPPPAIQKKSVAAPSPSALIEREKAAPAAARKEPESFSDVRVHNLIEA